MALPVEGAVNLLAADWKRACITKGRVTGGKNLTFRLRAGGYHTRR